MGGNQNIRAANIARLSAAFVTISLNPGCGKCKSSRTRAQMHNFAHVSPPRSQDLGKGLQISSLEPTCLSPEGFAVRIISDEEDRAALYAF